MSRAVHQIQRHLFQQSRENQSRPLGSIMRLVADWSVLAAAARLQPTDDGSPRLRGAYGKIWAPAADQRNLLDELAEQLLRGQYRPGPVRRFEVPKPGQPERKRVVTVLSPADRIVHAACKLVLDPILEARLSNRCFGFRTGRSRYDQLHAVRRLVQRSPQRYSFAVAADIAACFDQLDHQLLREDLCQIIRDDVFQEFFDRILIQVSYGQRGWLRHRPVGVLQGSPLSPVLANLNLRRLDALWARQHGDDLPLFRYADDLLVLAPDAQAATRASKQLARCARSANRLTLAPDKTSIQSFDEGVPVLGLVLRRACNRFENAPRVQIALDVGRVRACMQQMDSQVGSWSGDRPLGAQFTSLNQRLRGWFEAFQYACDAGEAFEALDRHLLRIVRERLKQLHGCSGAELQRRYGCRLPDGSPTWQADGVALLVFGSSPRKRYCPRGRRAPCEGRQALATLSPVDHSSIGLEGAPWNPVAFENGDLSPPEPAASPTPPVQPTEEPEHPEGSHG